MLDEIVSLSDLVTLEEVNVILEQDRAREYGIEQIPAIVLLKGDRGHAHPLPRRAGRL